MSSFLPSKRYNSLCNLSLSLLSLLPKKVGYEINRAKEKGRRINIGRIDSRRARRRRHFETVRETRVNYRGVCKSISEKRRGT